MEQEVVATGDLSFLGYIVIFGIAALACFVAASRIRHIDVPDTRRGLIAFLVTSGGWAIAHVAYLLAPTPQLKLVFYVAGLIVGVGAVGPWLYFCSAYTGRSVHRHSGVQTVAIVVYLVIVVVKITNPIHQLYFTAELITSPFPYLAINNRPLHWVVMGISYALASVGYFMLLEQFMQVDYDTKPLAALTAVTGLPIVLDLLGALSPLLIDITYEPLGVAAFAIGVAFVYVSRFQAVQLAGERDGPVIVLDVDDHIRDYNTSARELFPALGSDSAFGDSLETTLPELADTLHEDPSIISLEHVGGTRYYRVTTNNFAADRTHLGRLLTLTDITYREQYRQELERQNERLEEFAQMVSHDLRNPIEVATAGVELARTECDSHHLDEIEQALDRMDDLIEDVLTLARQGQPIDETESVSLSGVAEQCWQMIDPGEATLEIEGDLRFSADPDRLQQLLENLVRNAIEHGGSEVMIRIGPLDKGDGFYVADDGVGIREAERSEVFESGYTTATEGTGFGLAIVKEIVDAHGWEITVTESIDGGAQFEISGVDQG